MFLIHPQKYLKNSNLFAFFPLCRLHSLQTLAHYLLEINYLIVILNICKMYCLMIIFSLFPFIDIVIKIFHSSSFTFHEKWENLFFLLILLSIQLNFFFFSFVLILSSSFYRKTSKHCHMHSKKKYYTAEFLNYFENKIF